MGKIKLSSSESDLVEWFYATIFPTLPWYFQIGGVMVKDGLIKKFRDQLKQYSEILKISDVMEGDLVKTEALENGFTELFKHVQFLNAEIFGMHFKITKQNCSEILAGAKRIESQSQASAA